MVHVSTGIIPKPFGNTNPRRATAALRATIPLAITTGQQALPGHVVCLNLLATTAPSSEVQNINYSMCAPLQ